MDLQGLLFVVCASHTVLCAGADAQDYVDMVHSGTLHLVYILASSAICTHPAASSQVRRDGIAPEHCAKDIRGDWLDTQGLDVTSSMQDNVAFVQKSPKYMERLLRLLRTSSTACTMTSADLKLSHLHGNSDV